MRRLSSGLAGGGGVGREAEGGVVVVGHGVRSWRRMTTREEDGMGGRRWRLAAEGGGGGADEEEAVLPPPHRPGRRKDKEGSTLNRTKSAKKTILNICSILCQ